MTGTGPESAPGVGSQPLFSEAELLRLADDADPDVVAWAVARLQGSTLLRLLCGPHPEAAHQAAHALVDRVRAPDADAVRAAWLDVPEGWRRTAAAMAVRAGAADIAAGWAAHVDHVPAKVWIPAARELQSLAPEHLCPAAARLYRKVGDADPDADGLLSAACLEPSRLGPMVFRALNEADEELFADLAQALLVDEVVHGLREQLSPHRPPNDAAWTGWCTWRAATPPPWALCDDGRQPLRSSTLLAEALSGLVEALPPPPAGLSPQAAYLDQARRNCLAELGPPPLGSLIRPGVRVRHPVAATEARSRAWTLGVALYAAICHPLDWWRPLLAPGVELGEGAVGLEGMGDPVERALATLDPAYGDPASWYPVVAARVGGPGWIDRLLDAWERFGDADRAAPPLRRQRLFVQGVWAATAALATADARLDAATTTRLLDASHSAVERLQVDLGDIIDLGRWIAPQAVPVLRQAFGAAPCVPPTPGEWPDPKERRGLDRQRAVVLSLWAEMPDADAATQMADVAVQCDRDPFLWPGAAQWAVETGVPVALERVCRLWRPGDHELAAWLVRMDRVLSILGRPRPALPAEIRADGATVPPPDHYHNHGIEADGGQGQPLRLALQCPSCGRVHAYDVTRINVCVDPISDSPDRAAATPAGIPAGVRWGMARPRLGRHTVDVRRDVVLAPRQVCRSCGMGGRLRPTPLTIADMVTTAQAWDQRHNEDGCPVDEAHERRGDLRHVVPKAPAGAEWHDQVRNWPPLVRGDVAVAVTDLVDHAEGRAAAGTATAQDLLFLAQEWLAFGDPEAAAAFAQRAAGLGSDSAELHEILAELAEVRDDRVAAAAHWRSVLDRMGPGVGEPGRAARHRLAVLEPEAGAPSPVTPGRRAGPQARGRVRPVGRNDPCPCGSGKKYKRCHGA